MMKRCFSPLSLSIMIFVVVSLILLLLSETTTIQAFLVIPQPSFSIKNNNNRCSNNHRLLTSPSGSSSSTETKTTSSSSSGSNGGINNNNNPYGLTSELQKLTNAFEMIGDDKLRYKQLLFMANQLKPMDPSSMIPENKVNGCLSTVHIDGTTEMKDDGNTIVIHYTGNSDGLLTKGLVALLVRGLSGNTASDIQKVDPNFIKKAGIEQSLTPGRNNGFLNMLSTMKKKAIELENKAKLLQKSTTTTEPLSGSEEITTSNNSNHGPIYQEMVQALQMLKPIEIELRDVSYQHAGHREAGDSEESHFELYIVSDAFTDLNLVKRHKLIYMILGSIMPKIHALQIQAKTPNEIK